MSKPELSFYDLSTKKKFNSSDYKEVTKSTSKGNKTFAVAKNPSGKESWRIVATKKK